MHRSGRTDGRTRRRARGDGRETLTRPRREGGAGPAATATETAQTRRAGGSRATATRRGTPRERGCRAATGEDNRKNPNCRKRRQRGGAKAPRYPLGLWRGAAAAKTAHAPPAGGARPAAGLRVRGAAPPTSSPLTRLRLTKETGRVRCWAGSEVALCWAELVRLCDVTFSFEIIIDSPVVTKRKPGSSVKANTHPASLQVLRKTPVSAPGN